MLAVANAYRKDSYGMDVSLKCCRIAAEHCAQKEPEVLVVAAHAASSVS